MRNSVNVDINTMTIQIAKSPNIVNFSAFMAALLPWVPEAFLAYGGNFRCWPKADKPESALEKSLAPRVQLSRPPCK